MQHANTERKITRLSLEINVVLLFFLTVLVSRSRERQWEKLEDRRAYRLTSAYTDGISWGFVDVMTEDE